MPSAACVSVCMGRGQHATTAGWQATAEPSISGVPVLLGDGERKGQPRWGDPPPNHNDVCNNGTIVRNVTKYLTLTHGGSAPKQKHTHGSISFVEVHTLGPPEILAPSCCRIRNECSVHQALGNTMHPQCHAAVVCAMSWLQLSRWSPPGSSWPPGPSWLLLAPPGSSWLLLGPSESFWLSWLLLAPPSSSWLLLAPSWLLLVPPWLQQDEPGAARREEPRGAQEEPGGPLGLLALLASLGFLGFPNRLGSQEAWLLLAPPGFDKPEAFTCFSRTCFRRCSQLCDSAYSGTANKECFAYQGPRPLQGPGGDP